MLIKIIKYNFGKEIEVNMGMVIKALKNLACENLAQENFQCKNSKIMAIIMTLISTNKIKATTIIFLTKIS